MHPAGLRCSSLHTPVCALTAPCRRAPRETPTPASPDVAATRPEHAEAARAGGRADLGDGLRAGGAEVPARRLRPARQLRAPARGVPDRRRRHVDRHARRSRERRSASIAEQILHSRRSRPRVRRRRAAGDRWSCASPAASCTSSSRGGARARSCRSWIRRPAGAGRGTRRSPTSCTSHTMPVPPAPGATWAESRSVLDGRARARRMRRRRGRRSRRPCATPRTRQAGAHRRARCHAAG